MFALIIQGLDLLLMVLAYSLDWPLLSHLRTAATFVVGAVWLTPASAPVLPKHARAAAGWVAACTVLGYRGGDGELSWRRTIACSRSCTPPT